jgi:ABC-2 type transport system permease protein
MNSPTPAHIPLRFSAFAKLLLWMEWRALKARMASIRSQSRLLLSVLCLFVLGYLIAGYFLFHTGLSYVGQFPVVGTLLSQRVLFLIFGFFFLMLVFSNVITGYSTFFRNRETEWLVTLPIRHRHVFLWKFFESLVVSSWALLFLSIPLMLAYANVNKAGPLFFVQTTLLFIPFTVLPGVIGAWLILGLVRAVASHTVRRALVPVSIFALAAVIWFVQPTSDNNITSLEDALSFEQLLRHTRLTLNPYLPSAWMAQGVLASLQNLAAHSAFYLMLLLSYAAMGVLVAYEGAGRLFYSSWNFALSHQSLVDFKRKRKSHRPSGATFIDRFLDTFAVIPRPVRALLAKDFRIFWREPSQWTQFVLFFGLLCIYVLNLRNVSYDFSNPFWGLVISYLNLGASALTLSTLTTRFVFPQFSLEGRRLWIIGLAPLGLPRVLLQKFWSSTFASSAITVTLMLVSSIMLRMPLWKTLLFCGAISLMSASLSGIAVGLGALFPNLKETNPSKIVSGFGGTLCLVASFVYIVLSISILVVPAALILAGRFTNNAIYLVSVAALCILSAITIVLPMRAAIQKVKNLEF